MEHISLPWEQSEVKNASGEILMRMTRFTALQPRLLSGHLGSGYS